MDANFLLIDYIIMFTYIIAIAIFGAMFSKKQNTTKDYFLGGRSIPWWAVGLSVMATQASAITFIGAPGWGYDGGLESITTYLNVPLVMAFLIVTLVPFFYRTEVQTVYEFLEKRFDIKTRTLTAVLFLVARGLATGVVVYTPALVLSVVTGIDVNIMIILMAVIGVAYTVMGGVSAVVWTDVIQMFVLWAGAALALWVMVDTIPGGFSGALALAGDEGMLQSLDLSLDLSKEYSLLAGLVGGLFMHLAYFGADQSQIQRVLTSKSLKESRMSLMVSGIFIFPQMMLFLFIGIMLFSFYNYTGDPGLDDLNELFPLFVVNELPAGISGLIIAGVFAAAMSSLDSALNSLSAVSVRDLYRRFYKPDASEAHYLKASRWATLFWGLYATVFTFFAGNLGPVIEVINQIGSYFYGALFGVFILAIFIRRTTGTGAFIGIITGMIIVWTTEQLTDISYLYNNVIGTFVSIGVGWAASLTGKKPTKEQLQILSALEEDKNVQARLKKRADNAEKPDTETDSEAHQPYKWVLMLLGYFILTLLILLWFQSL
ncbi:sodium:solute symporter [Alteribacillus sp. HJP-4]|uniref:sodium:solute symporter n=1 Tax=Alteribacillus sp. HJP-4 TaxID=2775394 RepID=UPI0035CD0043